MSVWGSGGRLELTVSRFMALQKALRPDLYQSMADGETWGGASGKRLRKSVDRTLAHLDACLTIHQQTPVCGHTHTHPIPHPTHSHTVVTLLKVED